MLRNISSIFVGHCVVMAFPLLTFLPAVRSETTSQPHIQELLSSLTPTQAPQTRSKAKAVTEKPIINDAQKNLFEFTPLKSLFVDGMDDEQIWAQLDLRTKTICRMLDFVLEGESEGQDGLEEESSEDDQDDGNADEKLRKALEALENGEDVDMEEFMAEHGLDNEEMDDSDDSQDYEEEDSSDENGDQEEEGGEEISPLRDIELEAQSNSFIPPFPHRKKKGRNAATSELDDGFFDLAEFNAETERAEARSSSRGRLAGGDDSDEEDMDIDLFASVDPTVNMDDDAEGEGEGTSAPLELCHGSRTYLLIQSYSIATFLNRLLVLLRQLLQPNSRNPPEAIKFVLTIRFASKKSKPRGKTDRCMMIVTRKRTTTMMMILLMTRTSFLKEIRTS